MSEKMSILIVEDEFLIAMAIEDALTDAGYVTVGPATTLSQAFDLLSTSSIAAALVDVNLAGETCAPLAEHLATNNIPFILTTGYGATELVWALKPHSVLLKPFSQHALLQALAACIGPKAATR
jgi:CheY-like chemotaxis protein